MKPQDSRNWNPPELKPFDARVGALDAFALPSMVNGKRVERVPPRPMCVGAAGSMLAVHGRPRFAK